jgi:DNA-binding IclR family transcriptional regulator
LNAVRDFLAEYVESFDELTVLLALEATGGASTSAELSSRTRLADAALRTALEQLAARGLLHATPDAVRLAAADPRLAELAALYRDDTVAVLKMMNALALERVRLGATRAFADAFVIRRNKPDG